MNRQIEGSGLDEAGGWARTPVWVYDPGSGHQGPDRVGQAFGVRYISLTRHLDLCYYVAMATFRDGGARYSVARTFELSRLALPRALPIRIPASFAANIEFTYPGMLDCDSAILPLRRARRLALADFRQDPLFQAIVAL